MKKAFLIIGVVAILLLGTFIVFRFYSYIFAKNVTGEVTGIERVTDPSIIVGGVPANSPGQMYSFALAIKGTDGEIVTSSSEDRQWAVVQKGQCVTAKFYVYPPWNLDKGGTYFNARLIRLFECARAP